MALGDVSRAIDTQEVERHAPRTRPLQGGQAMGHLFQARPEQMHQDAEIVAMPPGRVQEILVGQHQGACEVICEGDQADGVGAGTAEAGLRQNRFRHVLRFEQGQLMRASAKVRLEASAQPSMRKVRGCPVELPDRPLEPERPVDLDRKPVAQLEPVDQGLRQCGDIGPEFRMGRLGLAVQIVDIVADPMKEVPHLVIGKGEGAGGRAGLRMRQGVLGPGPGTCPPARDGRPGAG